MNIYLQLFLGGPTIKPSTPHHACDLRCHKSLCQFTPPYFFVNILINFTGKKHCKFFSVIFKNFLNNSGWTKFFYCYYQQLLLIRILCLLYYSLGHLISMSLYIIVNIAVIFMVMYDHNIKLLFFVLHITQCVKKLFNGNPLCKSKLLIFYARNKYFKLN